MRAFRWTLSIALVLFLLPWQAAWSQADEAPAQPAAEAEPPAAAEPVDDAQLAELAKQLDDNRFSKRQQASAELAAAGRRAIPVLVEAAKNGTRESSTRGIDILKKFALSDDATTKSEAEAALKQLADGGDEATARRAQEALKDLEQPDAAPQAVPGLPGIRLGGAQIQMQIGGRGAGVKRITVRNANGVKQIDVEENGKKIKIEEDAKSIKVAVTEKKDGKEQTKKYEAKDADELKKKHPEAHKLYEQYGKQQGGIQIQQLQIGPIQPGQIPKRFAPPVLPAQPEDKLDGAQRRIGEARDQLRELSKESDNPHPAIADAIKRLDEAEAKLKEADE